MDKIIIYSLIGLIPIIVFVIIKRNSNRSNKIKYGDFESRIKEFSLRIQLDPNDSHAYYERGIAHLKSGNKKFALEDLKIAGQKGNYKAFDVIDHNNLNKSESNNFANSRTNLSEDIDVAKSQVYQGALKDYDKAIKADPNNSVAYFMRAEIKIVYKDYIGAIDDLTSAVRINSKFAEALFKRGSIKIKLNDNISAKRDLEVATSLGFKKAEKLLQKIKEV